MTLSDIKQKLNAFQLIHCGLKHEEVLLDDETHLPRMTGAVDEQVYKRRDLCANRKQRLGCAHTSANSSFESLLNDLAKGDKYFMKFKNQFSEVVFQIYNLDHKKGNLEKKYAEYLEVGNSNDLLFSDIKKDLHACKLLHSKYINELENVKLGVIQYIDKKLLENSRG